MWRLVLAVAWLPAGCGTEPTSPRPVEEDPPGTEQRVRVVIDTDDGQTPISPYIYGTNQDLDGHRWSVRRHGGTGCVRGMERRLIFITGDAASPGAARILSGLPAPVVTKPFTLQDLAERVERHAREIGSAVQS